MGSDVYGLPSRETYPDSQTWDLTLLIYELFFYPPNFSFPFFFFCRFSLEVSIIIPIFAASLGSSLVSGGRSYIWERRFRTSVVVSQELRKLLTSQQADDNETSAWSVSIYLSLIYSSFWRGLTALSILCDVGNAKAFGSRMGREQHLRLFYILRRT